MTAHNYEPAAERPTSPDLSMAYLAERLGFVEADEMTEVRSALTEAMASDSEYVRELAEDYQVRAEAVVDVAADSNTRNSKRIAANIAMALIRLDAGRVTGGIEDLYDVLDDIDGRIESGRDDLTAVAQMIERAIRAYMPDETEL